MRVTFFKALSGFRWNKRFVLKFVVPFFVLFVALTLPHFTFAAWWNPADWVEGFFAGLIVSFGKALLNIGFLILNFFILIGKAVLESPAVSDSWGNIRNIALSLFSLMVIAVALMNILKWNIQIWGVNRMVPRLFLGAFLVIFSKFICISIINFSASLANSFMRDGMGAFTNPLGEMVTNFANFEPEGNIVVALVFLFGCLFAIAMMALLGVILILRGMILVLLVVISPVAFAIMVLPWTEKYYSSWWKHFARWVFFYPICVLILSIGLSIGEGAAETGYLDSVIAGWMSTGPLAPLVAFLTNITLILIMLISIPLAVYFPLKMLTVVGGTLQNILSGKTSIPGMPTTGNWAALNPAAWRTAYEQRQGKRKAQRGRNIRSMMDEGGFPFMRPLTTRNGELNRLGRVITANERGTFKDNIREDSKELDNLKLSYGVRNAMVRHLADPGNEENREKFFEMAEREGKTEDLQEFIKNHSAEGAFSAALENVVSNGIADNDLLRAETERIKNDRTGVGTERVKNMLQRIGGISRDGMIGTRPDLVGDRTVRDARGNLVVKPQITFDNLDTSKIQSLSNDALRPETSEFLRRGVHLQAFANLDSPMITEQTKFLSSGRRKQTLDLISSATTMLASASPEGIATHTLPGGEEIQVDIFEHDKVTEMVDGVRQERALNDAERRQRMTELRNKAQSVQRITRETENTFRGNAAPQDENTTTTSSHTPGGTGGFTGGAGI